MKNLTKKQKILRTSLVVAIILVIITLTYFILRWTGAWEAVNSVEKIKNLILNLGFWGRFVFVFLQFLQVTFLPIPAAITTIAGSLIYGPLQAALLSLSGVFLGSIFAFWLGRTFGRKLVEFMVGKETCEKWIKILTEGKYAFFVMMLLPIFPDDILCMVAGLTEMSWSFFCITNLISRPIAIFMTCYLGSGDIIPYHGWGLLVWAVLIFVAIVVLILSIKFRTQIENFVSNLFKQREKSECELKRNDLEKSSKTKSSKIKKNEEVKNNFSQENENENKIKNLNKNIKDSDSSQKTRK